MFSRTERSQAAGVGSLTGVAFKESSQEKEQSWVEGDAFPRTGGAPPGGWLVPRQSGYVVRSHTVQGAEHLVHPKSGLQGP